jgi:alpha/beta superfamily hydrolase
MFSFAAQHRPQCPWLVVQGDADEVTDVNAVREWLADMPTPPQFEVMSGASHFFHGRLPELRERCSHFVRDSLAGNRSAD